MRSRLARRLAGKSIVRRSPLPGALGSNAGTWVALAAFIASLALVSAPTLEWLGRSWAVHPYYSHGPLLMAAALWLCYRARDGFRPTPQPPHPAGVAAAALGAAIALAALPREAHLWSIAGLALAVVGAAGIVAGREGLRAALFPASLALLAVPIPAAERVAPILAAHVAEWAAGAAGLMGVSVIRSGVQLTVADGSYTVGGPCSGLRSLLALVALAYLAAGLSRIGLPRRAFLVAIALPLALGANWIRLTGLLVLTDGLGARAGLSVFEGPASPLLFAAALGAVVAVGWRLEDGDQDQKAKIQASWPQPPDDTHEKGPGPGAQEPVNDPGAAAPTGRLGAIRPAARRIAALLALAAVLCGGLAWRGAHSVRAGPVGAASPNTHVLYADVAGWYERTPDEVAILSPFDLSLDGIASDLPYELGVWRGHDRALADDIGRWLADPDVALTRTYVRQDGAVVWLSAFGSRGDKSFHLFEHTPVTCYPLSGWTIESLERTPLHMGPRPLTVELGRAVSGDDELAFATMYVWSSPSRDSRNGVMSLRLAAPVVGEMGWDDARDVLTDDFLRELFAGTLSWSAF